ncbi:MAG: tRNA epoxyqueuosine(34) reductase QueG, partial [bacterium]|nr:tRNA epoxyqueuosine(34) reductase QueG [bacterium]
KTVAPDDPAPRGQIAKYAWGDDYHDVIKDRLFELLAAIKVFAPTVEGRVYVDTGPLLERDIAVRAGLGWFGKHTGIINKRMGSWFFLAEIILNVQLEADKPQLDHCGSCTRCIDACPTDAIVEPYVLDARRCISYLTIEMGDRIPRELRPGIGSWIYGCDICQDVCPWNLKHGKESDESAFKPGGGRKESKLVELLHMDQPTFSATFKGSPIKRTKRRGLLRNVAVALGNVGTRDDVPDLGKALADEEPLVRQHVAWALGQIGGHEALDILTRARASEADATVIEEMILAIDHIQTEKG